MALTALCFSMQAIAHEGESGLSTLEYVYKTIGEKKLKMHVDIPPGWKKTDTRPVIVFFHGGSWKGGSVRAFAPQAKYIAEGGRHGFFNSSPWLERTMIAADEFLATLGYLEGEPTIEAPQAEQDGGGAKSQRANEE